MSRASAIAGLAALLATAAGCREPPAPDPRLAAAVELVPKVEGEPTLTIPVGDYRAAVARLRLQRAESLDAKPLPEALEAHVLDQLLRERVLADEANRLSVKASTTAVAAELQALRDTYPKAELARRLAETYQTEGDLHAAITRRLAAAALLEKAAFAKLEVDDAELQRRYQALPASERQVPPRVRAAQIVVSTEEEAQRIHRALTRGADFATLAETVSIAPEASRGGALGWFAAKEMPEVFEQACLPLKAGDLSAVTPSQFGYHICKVLERADARPRTFDEMKSELRARALTEARREAESKYVARLLDRYQVVRHPDRIALEN